MAYNNNGKDVYFHPPGFIGIDGAQYKLVRFSENDFHMDGVRTHMNLQAQAHGLTFARSMIKPLTEALVNGKCSAVLCVRTPTKNTEQEKVVALMTYTRDISNVGEINFLEDIVVSEEYRNQRIGTKCLSSFILYSNSEGKEGFRLHTRSNNTYGTQLFNRFGNTVFNPLPPIMEIPRECVDLPANVALFGPEHMNKAFEILATQLNWSNIRLLSDIAYNRAEGAEGLVCLDKDKEVTGIALSCSGFGTVDCTTNTHINTIASTKFQTDIPALIQGIKHRHKLNGRLGHAILDFRDNSPAIWGQIKYLAERSGATAVTRAGSEMVAGALGGEAFKVDAVKIADKTLKFVSRESFYSKPSKPRARSRMSSATPIQTFGGSLPHLQLQNT